MLTPYLPYPPSSGGQVRSYNLIKNLSKKHEITLFSLIKTDNEKKYVSELEKYCKKVRIFKRPEKPWTLKNILRTGFGLYPFLVIRNLSDEEKTAVAEELTKEKFDLIHAENFYAMPHIPNTTVPILLTEQTIFYAVYKRFVESLSWYLFWLKPALMIDVLKLKYWETYYWKKANLLVDVSEEDNFQIKKQVPNKRVYIVPNGVDFEYYSKPQYPKNSQPTVLFGAADFHWMENKEGAKVLIEEIWPEIKKHVANAKLWIVGKIAPQALSVYVGQKDIVIQEINDSREAYQRSWVLVAPLRSRGGSRTKFFEAMASGLPIVTTSMGIEGIRVNDSQQIMIANDRNQMIAKAISVLEDKKLAKNIGQQARDLVSDDYDWKKCALLLDKVYQEVENESKN